MTPLSPQEQMILSLMTQGLTTTQIIERLDIALPTFKTYMRNIRLKTGTKSTFMLGYRANEILQFSRTNMNGDAA